MNAARRYDAADSPPTQPLITSPPWQRASSGNEGSVARLFAVAGWRTGSKMSEEFHFALRLPAHPISVSVARAALKPLGRLVDEVHLEGAELVLSELVTNSICHGSPNVQNVIDVDITANAQWVRGVVRDHGPPFDPLGVSRASEPPGGFGLHIVRCLADLAFDRSEAGNVVTFTVPAAT